MITSPPLRPTAASAIAGSHSTNGRALVTGFPPRRPGADEQRWEVLLPGAWRSVLTAQRAAAWGTALVEEYQADGQAAWLAAYLDTIAPPD